MKLPYKLINHSDKIKRYNKKSPKSCYYCAKSDVEFKAKPHLISQLLGSNTITYNHECDECNKFFSETYENDLQKFAQPFLMTSQTKSGNKNKHTKYKPHSKSNFSIQFKNGTLLLTNYDPKHNLVKIDHANKTASVEIPRTSFIPINVYKGFMKIGIGLIPEDKIHLYKDAILWLRDADATKLYFPNILTSSFTFRLANKKFDKPFAELYEAEEIINKNKEYINHILVIGFANILMQFFLPPSLLNIQNQGKGHELSLEIYPMVLHHFKYFKAKNINYTRYDLYENRKISMEEVFSIKFAVSA